MIREKEGACSLHWPYAFESLDGGSGDADAELVFHPTRGWTVRVNRFRPSGSGKDATDLLEAIAFRGRRYWVSATYVSARPDAAELIAAAEAAGYQRLNEAVMSVPLDFDPWRAPSRFEIPDVPAPPGVMIRRMRLDEYDDVRERLLPLVSGGTYVATRYGSFDQVSLEAYRPFVAEFGGRVVAYAENNVHHEDGSTRGWDRFARVERVVVERESRGMRISGCLVAALLRDAAEWGCSRVDLQVGPDNVPAVKTYERLGFRRTDGVLFAKTIV